MAGNWQGADDDRAVLINPPAPEIGTRHSMLWGRGRQYHVADFRGPLSIKSVVRGAALWETKHGRFLVDPGSYLVLNEGQRYSITIDAEEPVETFCLFFKKGFVEGVFRSLVTPEERLLEEPEDTPASSLGFFEMLLPKEPQVARELARMHGALSRRRAAELWLEERLQAVATGLLRVQTSLKREIDRLPAVRASTREALFRRIRRARDFIESSLPERLTLDRVAREACLSPYHLHRLFTQSFRETPHRYITRRRLERARELLQKTDRPVTEVCWDVGFESLGSFSWLFRQRFGVSPREFRLANKKSKF